MMSPVVLVISLAMLKELEIEKDIVVDQLIDGSFLDLPDW